MSARDLTNSRALLAAEGSERDEGPVWHGETAETGSADPGPVHLTPRQLEILALLCEGCSNKVIGRRLHISAGTVKVHVGNILRTLNVSSRLEAVCIARRYGLVDDANATPVVRRTPRRAHHR